MKKKLEEKQNVCEKIQPSGDIFFRLIRKKVCFRPQVGNTEQSAHQKSRAMAIIIQQLNYAFYHCGEFKLNIQHMREDQREELDRTFVSSNIPRCGKVSK